MCQFVRTLSFLLFIFFYDFVLMLSFQNDLQTALSYELYLVLPVVDQQHRVDQKFYEKNVLTLQVSKLKLQFRQSFFMWCRI
jgi:hypothetical protein